MQQAYGVAVPETVAEMCSPTSTAVLVYDVQVGILSHVQDRDSVIGRIRAVITAARAADVPVVYVRHVSVPPSHMGVAAFRTAMAWQRTQRAAEVRSAFPPDAPQTQLVPELAPEAGEPVFDKLGMSAFVGTPVETVLRDRRLTTVVLVGAVLEIGIEPTARHAADLGFLPVVVDDACGIVEREAAARAVASLDYTLLSYRTSAEELVAALAGP
jgi:biuret amidohydrolase